MDKDFTGGGGETSLIVSPKGQQGLTVKCVNFEEKY